MSEILEKTPEILQVDSINGLAVKTRNEITEAFTPFANQFAEWEEKALKINITDLSQVADMKLAREARLALVKVRTGTDAKRKELKEDSLKYGKAVQEVYNKIEGKILSIEAHLEQQEKFKEIEEARIKAERTTARMDKVKEFPDVSSAEVENMTDETFEAFVMGLVAKRDKAIEDARVEEESRIAEAKAEQERREAERKEMERLKAENEAKEKELEVQRKSAEAEKAKQQAILDAERKKAEQEKKKQEEAIAKQKAENEKLQAEIKRKAEEEARIKKQQEEKAAEEEKQRIAAEKKAAKAPDREKLTKWVDDCLLGLTPSVGGEAHKVAYEIQAKFAGFRTWAKEQIEKI